MFKYLTVLFFIYSLSAVHLAGQETRQLYNVIIEKGETEGTFTFEYEVYLRHNKKRDEYFTTTSLDTFIMILMKDLSGLESEKNDLLIYIHGMWGGTKHMFNQASRLMHEAYVEHPESNVARILSVKWPGNTSQYFTNKESAFALAPQLKRVFSKLFRTVQLADYLDFKKDFRISLMAHSLGNEIVKALFNYYEGKEFNQTYFDEMILAAPDLDDNLFEEDQLFDQLHKVAERVHVYFSRKDLTLNMSKAINEKNRLGVSGPSQNSIIQDNILFIDVSDVKDERNLRDRITGHSYYRISELATSDMRNTLIGTAHSDIPKRQLLNEKLNIYKLVTEEELTP